jgi:hypothetical protein
MPKTRRLEEVLNRRQTIPQDDKTVYKRVYLVDKNDLDNLPVEGDPLPGEADAVLGPFIMDISYGQQRGGAKQEVHITAFELIAES